MKKFLLVLMLLISTCSYAQTAQVVQLTSAEAFKGADLYKRKAEIEEQIAEFRNKISERYIQTPSNVTYFSTEKKVAPKKVSYYFYKIGWESGFVFSADFKFIVPDTILYKGNCPLYSYTLNPGTYYGDEGRVYPSTNELESPNIIK